MQQSPLNLTDVELIARLTQTEDAFVERKAKGDTSGWLRTVVAFANSATIGLPAVLFLGVDNDGTIQDGVNVERTLQQFSDFIGQHAWPPIYTLARALTHGGRSCVAVIVPGSPERPHFAGRAYVREGTQTKDGSARQFAELIASHISKGRELQKWTGQRVTFIHRMPGVAGDSEMPAVEMIACNQHFATFMRHTNATEKYLFSEPLDRIALSFDHGRQQLQLFIYLDR